MIRHLSFLIMFCAASVVYAQEIPETPEQRALLEDVKSLARSGKVEEAVDLCNELLSEYRAPEYEWLLNELGFKKANLWFTLGSRDSMLAAYNQLSQIGEALGLGHIAVKFKLMEAQSLKLFGSSDAAIAILKEVKQVSFQYPRQHSLALQEYAILMHQRNWPADSTFCYLDSALQISFEIKDSLRICSVLETRGTAHYSLGAYLTSTDDLLEAVKYTTDKSSLKKVDLLSKVGGIFHDIRQLEKARHYTSEALALSEQLNFSRATALAQNQLGMIALTSGDTDNAALWLHKANENISQHGRPKDQFAARCNLADLYISTGDFTKASMMLDSVPGIIAMIGPEVQCRYYRLQSQVAMQNGQFQLAAESAERATDLAAKAEDAPEVIAALRVQREVYRAMGRNDLALQVSDQLIARSDSLFELQQSQLLFDTEARYQKAAQDREIASLNATNRIKDMALMTRQRQLLLGAIALMALVALAVVLYRRAVVRQKTAAVLADKNAQITKALKEKELLLREIHHRVKNNLQVVSSLLSLQSRFIDDENALEAINQGRDRVKSMALIHQNLYQEHNLTGIQISSYFEKLVRSLFNSYNISPGRIQLVQSVENINLDVDTVIPLGLVVNELVSNALKYAFPDERNGTIHVSLREVDDQLILNVRDDGIGVGDAWDHDQSESFGYRLIHAFKAKLNAELEVNGAQGTEVEMRIREYQKAG